MAAQVGALRVTLGANTAQYEAGMRKAQATARRTGQDISSSLQKASKSAIGSLAAIGAAAGVVSLAALGRAAVDVAVKFRRIDQSMKIAAGSVQAANEELKFARELADRLGVRYLTLAESYVQLAAAARGTNLEGKESRRIFEGITTAIVATGGSAEQAEGALRAVQQMISKGTVASEELRGQLGERLPGAFQIAARSLGVTTAELGKFLEQGQITAEEFLPRFIDQMMRELPQGVEAADAPFQRFQTTLDDIANSTAEGFMKELGEATDDLADILKDMHQSGALAAFGSFLGDIITLGATVASALGTVIEKFYELRELLPEGGASIASGFGPLGAAWQMVQALGNSQSGSGRSADGSLTLDLPDAPVSIPQRAPFKPVAKAKKGPKGPSAEALAARAERERIEKLRDIAGFESDLRSLKIEELQNQRELAEDGAARYNISNEILKLEDEQYTANLKLAVDTKELTAAQAEQLQIAHDAVSAGEQQIALEEERIEHMEEEFRLNGVDLDLQEELLSLRSSLATTAAERRDIELRMLKIAFDQERLEIARLKASKDWADQEEARRREATLKERESAATAGVLQNTQGPLEAWRESIPDTAAEMNEALQSVAADGLKSLEDGLVGILTGTKSVKEAFHEMAASILADLIRIQVQQMIMKALSAIGGFSSGGLASTDFGMNPSTGPIGMASGGAVIGPGTKKSDSILARLSNGEYVLNAGAVGKFGTPFLDTLNKGKLDPQMLLGGIGADPKMLFGAVGGGGGGIPFAGLLGGLLGFKDGGMVGIPRYAAGGPVARIDAPIRAPRPEESVPPIVMSFANDFRGADPSSVAAIQNRLNRFEAEFPAKVVNAYQDARSRHVIR